MSALVFSQNISGIQTTNAGYCFTALIGVRSIKVPLLYMYYFFFLFSFFCFRKCND